MLEIKVTIDGGELANAINNLAAAIGGNKQKEASSPTRVSTQEAPAPSSVQKAPTESVQTAAGVPLAQAPSFTREQIMYAGSTLVDAGKMQELINLLHTFGVAAVTELKTEQLGAFATAMRELGAKI